MFKRTARKITEIRKLNLGSEEIEVKVTLSRRRSTAIIVRPDMCVEVKAPLRVSMPKLMKHLEGKAYWVLKQREKFKGRAGSAGPKEYKEGELFSFLGERYELRLIASKLAKVEMNGRFLDVYCRARSAPAVKALLKFWYNEKARELFEGRLPICLEATAMLKLPRHRSLNVKKMKSRWGSCSAGGIITLNPELAAAPLECVDYVIIHELCHLREHNHSPSYYKLLSAAMPGWKAYREHLNRGVETNFI